MEGLEVQQPLCTKHQVQDSPLLLVDRMIEAECLLFLVGVRRSCWNPALLAILLYTLRADAHFLSGIELLGKDLSSKGAFSARK